MHFENVTGGQYVVNKRWNHVFGPTLDIHCSYLMHLLFLAIIWTNADPIHWRIYAALGGDEF